MQSWESLIAERMANHEQVVTKTLEEQIEENKHNQMLERSRRYYKNHRKERLEHSSKWDKEHPEKRRERYKRWKEKHKV